MVAPSQQPQRLLAKNIAALALLVVGLALAAAGFYYASTPMTVIGIAALIAGAVVLVWKIRARNERV